MRDVYTVTGVGMTLKTSANPTTLLFINPGTTCSLQVLRMSVSQYGTTTSTQFGIQVSYQPTSFPTVVSATPAKMATLDQASAITGATTGAAGTCGVNASAEGSGTKVPILAYGPNNLNGWEWIATPDEQILLSAGSANGLGIVMLTTWATLNTLWNVLLSYKEI